MGLFPLSANKNAIFIEKKRECWIFRASGFYCTKANQKILTPNSIQKRSFRLRPWRKISSQLFGETCVWKSSWVHVKNISELFELSRFQCRSSVDSFSPHYDSQSWNFTIAALVEDIKQSDKAKIWVRKKRVINFIISLAYWDQRDSGTWHKKSHIEMGWTIKIGSF